MIKKKCKDCGKMFEVEERTRYSRYPRKYCDKCSKARKKAYEKIDEITFEECED